MKTLTNEEYFLLNIAYKDQPFTTYANSNEVILRYGDSSEYKNILGNLEDKGLLEHVDGTTFKITEMGKEYFKSEKVNRRLLSNKSLLIWLLLPLTMLIVAIVTCNRT